MGSLSGLPTLHRLFLVLVGLIVIGLAAPPARAEFPQPQGRVNDFAAVLDEGSKTELTTIIREAEAASSAEIAVVTVASLDGMSVEEYSSKLFEAWGIGKKGIDNGVLILVAPKDRAMRIEVGYGLEAVLPDSLAGTIIRSEFTPAFKAGDYSTGILKGVSRVAAIVRENQPVKPEEQRTIETTRTNQIDELVVHLVLTLFLIVPVVFASEIIGYTIRGKSCLVQVLVAGFLGVPLLLVLLVAIPWVLGPLAVLMIVHGYRPIKAVSFVLKAFGSVLPRMERSTPVGDSSSSGDWSTSGGDSGSSGGGSDFGGGSSGGGGASGRW
jgi:uncharacterized protein